MMPKTMGGSVGPDLKVRHARRTKMMYKLTNHVQLYGARNVRVIGESTSPALTGRR